MKKNEIEKKLNFTLRKKNFLVTYHPVTLKKDYGIEDFKIVLEYLATQTDNGIIFTFPNTDTSNYEIIRLIKKFVKNNNSAYFKYLGRQIYFSLIKHFDLIIGNSSSGIAEVPSFKKPSIDIGIRQQGRLMASSIII